MFRNGSVDAGRLRRFGRSAHDGSRNSLDGGVDAVAKDSSNGGIREPEAPISFAIVEEEEGFVASLQLEGAGVADDGGEEELKRKWSIWVVSECKMV